MMFPPSIMHIRIAGTSCRGFNLWLPLILLWPFALVLGLALAPLVLIAALCTWPRYGRMLLLGGPRLFGMLCALRGLRVYVEDGKDRVHVYFL